ncbi:TIGR01777 family protein [Sphingobacteriaceae bacterium]|nr:TIGR01777 family protein [Sphingobacteriaceae bacterium]
MAKILITGGSGLVGKAISDLLLTQGHEVRWLSREASQSPSGSGKIVSFKWDIKTAYIDEKAMEGLDHIIHLSGAGIIDKRWTEAYKRELVDSRVKSTELLFKTISKRAPKLKSFIGASAVGYYGSDVTDHVFTETDEAVLDNSRHDFLAEVCIAWENSYKPIAQTGLRTAIIRTGIVLSKEGGAYAKMVTPFKFGLGAAIASGKQYFPWIHIKDLAQIYVYALFQDNVSGAYNAVSSVSINNDNFSRALAKSLNKAFFLPNVPEFALKLALGERAVTITRGVQISNEKIKAAGYNFAFDDLEEALRSLN